MDQRKLESRYNSRVTQNKQPPKFNQNHKSNLQESPVIFRKTQQQQKQNQPVYPQKDVYSEQRFKTYNQNSLYDQQAPKHTQQSIPQLQQSNENELLSFLQEIEMDQYADNFIQNRIKFSNIHLLQKDDLREIGIPVGDRNIILHHIQLLQDQNRVQPSFEIDKNDLVHSQKYQANQMRNSQQKFEDEQLDYQRDQDRYMKQQSPSPEFPRQNQKYSPRQYNHIEQNSKENKVFSFLSEIGHQQYYGIFENNCITYEDLKLLSRQDLVELGIPIGPRNAIMHHIKDKIQHEKSEMQGNQKQQQRTKAQSFQNDESPNVSFSSEERNSYKFSPQQQKKKSKMKSQVNDFLQGVDQINQSKQLNRSSRQQLPKNSSPQTELLKNQNQQNIELLIQQLVLKQDEMLKAIHQNVQIIDKLKQKPLSTMPSQPSLSEPQSAQEDQNQNYKRKYNRKNDTKIPSYREVYNNIQTWKKNQ